MSKLSEEEIPEAALKYTVFGRVLPEQKLALVKSLKASGKTVAMMGDGVNDVPALKEADCSIAVQEGSDAARSVSQLVLMNSEFSTLPLAVAEGRRCINNIERSAALFLVKTIFSFLLAAIFLILQKSNLIVSPVLRPQFLEAAVAGGVVHHHNAGLFKSRLQQRFQTLLRYVCIFIM